MTAKTNPSGLAGHSGHDGAAMLVALGPPRECGLGKAEVVPRLAQGVERRLKSINISHPQQPLPPTSAGSLTSGGGLSARRSKTVQGGPRRRAALPARTAARRRVRRPAAAATTRFPSACRTASIASNLGGVMAAVSIRDLDDAVRERLRVRAARHGLVAAR